MMMTIIPENKREAIKRPKECGNAFFLVMLGVVLFGALMFTLSRGARQGGQNISQKQAEIAASEILSFAQKAERGVANVMRTASFSEVDISFDNELLSDYENPGCTSPRCEVFNPSGGAISYIERTNDMNNGSQWFFSGENTISGIGADANADLLIMLNTVRPLVCDELNERLGITPMPVDSDGIETETKFIGGYNNSDQISDSAIKNLSSACVLNKQPTPDEYLFYYVLRAR